MSPPKHELVIEDCNSALNLDRHYVKALNRRAGALEALKRYEEALRGTSEYQYCWRACLTTRLVDFTAGTILDKFQNETAAQAVERVLKKLAGEKAEEILAVCCSAILIEHLLKSSKQTRESRLPSFTFISAYFAAFRSRQCKTFSCPV
jgi:mitochondrial import receptor subunit TOM70